MVEPESVPVADPETCMLPMHVALNVPDPDVPVKLVTVQRKFTHESASDPDAPGSDCVVAQLPLSRVFAVGVGLVLVEKSKHAALAPAATSVNATANRLVIVIIEVALQGQATGPL